MNEQEARRMMYEYGPRNVNLYVSIVNRSIVPTWEKCKRIINESMEIEGVTEEMLEHAEEMIEYCNLSAKWCQLDAYSRKLGLHDHEIMLEYCEELLATMMTMHIDSAARDTLVYENSFSALLQRIPGDRAIVLDGKPVQDLKELEAMDPLEVVTIRIFHHAMSERMYGRYGRNGVVEMKTLRKIREDVSGMPDGPDKRELMSLYGMKP